MSDLRYLMKFSDKRSTLSTDCDIPLYHIINRFLLKVRHRVDDCIAHVLFEDSGVTITSRFRVETLQIERHVHFLFLIVNRIDVNAVVVWSW